MYNDTKTKEQRIGWFVPRYKRIYLGIMAVWLPVFMVMTLVTVYEFQVVASTEYHLAHSFKPVH